MGEHNLPKENLEEKPFSEIDKCPGCERSIGSLKNEYKGILMPAPGILICPKCGILFCPKSVLRHAMENLGKMIINPNSLLGQQTIGRAFVPGSFRKIE